MSVDFKEFTRKMDKTLEHLGEDFGAVRAGRANPQVLDRICVEYYGSETPLNGVATISSPDARTLVISPWDSKLLKDIQKLTGLVLDPDSGRLTPGMQTDTKSPRKQESSKPAAPKQAAQGADGRTPAGQSGDAKGPRRRRRNAPKREGQAQSAHAPQPQNGGGQASENREPGRRRPHRRRRSDRKSEGQRS